MWPMWPMWDFEGFPHMKNSLCAHSHIETDENFVKVMIVGV